MTSFWRDYGLYWGLGMSIAVAYAVNFFRHEVWLIPTDPYYYLSMADSLLESGQLMDQTESPSLPFKTLQNAMPFVYACLKKAGIGNLPALRWMSFIHWAAWVSAFFPFWKLVQSSSVEGRWSRRFLVLSFLGAGHLLAYQMIPGTDGLFNAGVVWLVFFFIKALDRPPLGQKPKPQPWAWGYPVLIFGLSIVLVHFSLRLMCYMSALLIGILCSREHRCPKNVLLAAGALLTGCLSITIPYLAADISRISTEVGTYRFAFLDQSEAINIMLSRYLGLGWLLAASVGHSLLIALVLFVGYCFYEGFRQRSLLTMIFSVSIGLFLAINLLLPGPVMIQAGPRYMISTLPFACLLGMRFRSIQPLTIALILLFTFITVVSIAKGYPRNCSTAFWRHMAKQEFRVPPNAMLIAERSRYAYVMLAGRSFNGPITAIDPKHTQIWVTGSATFINQKYDEIQKLSKIQIQDAWNLSDDYQDTCGNALVAFRVRFEK